MGEGTSKMSTKWNEERATSTKYEDSRIASESSDDYEENTEQLRAGIEDTRTEMSETINEIQERLSPERLMGQMKETVREATIGKVEKAMDKVGETIAEVTEPAREAMGRAGTAIKETGMSVGNSMWRNPIPVALIGVGLGWLMVRRYRGSGGDYEMPGTRPRTRLNIRTDQTEYGATTGPLDQVKETASELANRSTNALSNLGTKAKDGASAIGTRFGQVLRDNPLAVGAVAVAAGTAVGLVLPSTRFEKEYVGEASEKLVDKAQEVAREAIDKVETAAKQMAPEQHAGA
jgi:hypothetical protein